MKKNEIIDWWNSLSFEDKFFKAIEATHVLEGDTVDNNPEKLTEEQIELIYKYNFDIKSTVRNNMLESNTYTPYCMRCTGLQRLSIVELGKQLHCDKCGITTRFSKEFLLTWKKKHEDI